MLKSLEYSLKYIINLSYLHIHICLPYPQVGGFEILVQFSFLLALVLTEILGNDLWMLSKYDNIKSMISIKRNI